MESNFGDEWIEYGIGDGTFAITTMDLEHKPGVRGGVIAFEVLDLDMTLNRFKELDVRSFVKFSRHPFAAWPLWLTLTATTSSSTSGTCRSGPPANAQPSTPRCHSKRRNEGRYLTAPARILGKSSFAESLTKGFWSSSSASACGNARRWSAGERISRQANNACCLAQGSASDKPRMIWLLAL